MCCLTCWLVAIASSSSSSSTSSSSSSSSPCAYSNFFAGDSSVWLRSSISNYQLVDLNPLLNPYTISLSLNLWLSLSSFEHGRSVFGCCNIHHIQHILIFFLYLFLSVQFYFIFIFFIYYCLTCLIFSLDYYYINYSFRFFLM